MEWAVRLVWFLFVGWWFTLLWLAAAVLLAILVIWYPIGLFMVANTWTVLTRKRPLTDLLAELQRLR